MFEPERLDDELEMVERRLERTKFVLMAESRDRMLFACGRAAGFAEARGIIFRWRATAAAIGLLAGALLVATLAGRTDTDRARNLSEAKSTASPIDQHDARPPVAPTGVQSVTRQRKPAGDAPRPPAAEPRKLSAGMPLDEALALLESAPAQIEFPVFRPEQSPRPPLRASSVEFQ